MNKLIVEKLRTFSIKFSQGKKTHAMSDLGIWNVIISKILVQSFAERSAYWIIVTPQPYSFSYREQNSTTKIHVNNEIYSVSDCENCSSSLLIDIASSEDFRRGLLWVVVSINKNLSITKEIIRAVIESKYLISYPNISGEIMMMDNDGEVLYWFNYKLPVLEKVQSSLDKLSKSFGWEIEFR